MMQLTCACVILFARMASSLIQAPTLKLSNGNHMPAIALGTYLGFDQTGALKSHNKTIFNIVLHAIDVGYRHIDTAAIYNTEGEIGEALKLKLEEGKVKREDIFITTKLWNTHHRREQVEPALKESLKQLGLDYVDLYLMHWPMAINEDYTFSNVDYMETWRGLEDIQKLGLAKSIGVSNFNKHQLERLLNESSVKPVALQIEVHPQIVQSELVNFAQSHDIVVMGYSPFGSLVSRLGFQLTGPRIDDPVLTKLAEKYGKTTPQVVLRWLVDRSIVPIPKTVNPKRLEENINIFDFKLENEEIETINKFDTHTRYTVPSFWQTHTHYPFEKVDNPIANPFVKKN